MAIVAMVALVACEGPLGPRGDQGVQGQQGEQGAAGELGASGTDGVDGDDGELGAPGTDGIDALDSKDGTVHVPATVIGSITFRHDVAQYFRGGYGPLTYSIVVTTQGKYEVAGPDSNGYITIEATVSGNQTVATVTATDMDGFSEDAELTIMEAPATE